MAKITVTINQTGTLKIESPRIAVRIPIKVTVKGHERLNRYVSRICFLWGDSCGGFRAISDFDHPMFLSGRVQRGRGFTEEESLELDGLMPKVIALLDKYGNAALKAVNALLTIPTSSVHLTTEEDLK